MNSVQTVRSQIGGLPVSGILPRVTQPASWTKMPYSVAECHKPENQLFVIMLA